MSVVIVIPARFASTRYPGKPLVELRGAGGQPKTLIRRSWEAAVAVRGAARVIVATDDTRIADHAAGFGAEVAMTSAECRNGTERCAEVLAGLSEPPEMVVNLQGDAPLTPAWFVEDLVAGLRAAPGAQVATPVLNCSGAMRADLLADRAAGRVGGTTAVFGVDRHALYFSKEVIPFVPHEVAPDEVVDTTGAGDAFCGALAASLAGGAGREAALDVALAAGAAAVRHRGAQPDPDL